MQLIPSLVLQHLSNPAHLESLFVNYIKKAGLRIDASKTIAGVAYYHKVQFALNATNIKMFSGAYDAAATNMPGNSFIRPQSEHILIWAIRFESVVALSFKNQLWTPGVGASSFLANLNMTVTTNSEVKIKDFPLSEALENLTVRTNGLIPLAEPIFWGGQQDFVIDLENNENTGAPDAQQCLKGTLIGLGLI